MAGSTPVAPTTFAGETPMVGARSASPGWAGSTPVTCSTLPMKLKRTST